MSVISLTLTSIKELVWKEFEVTKSPILRTYYLLLHPFSGQMQTDKHLVEEIVLLQAQIARFMGPTWGPPGPCRPQMGPRLARWTLLSGYNLRKNATQISYDPQYTNSTPHAWWRHRMETFSALLTFCAGNSPVTGEFPAQRPVTQSFDVFVDLCQNKRMRKQ